jgi:hypothetical protein
LAGTDDLRLGFFPALKNQGLAQPTRDCSTHLYSRHTHNQGDIIMANKNITKIVQNLSDLLNAVEADTEKTTKKVEKTEKKQTDFFEDFWHHINANYRDILTQYNHMRQEGRTELTITVKNKKYPDYTNFKVIVSYLERQEEIYVYVNAYDEDADEMVNCLTVAESDNGVRIRHESTGLARTKLVDAIQYIKSGQFDADFAKEIQSKCKEILVKNELLRKSA